MQIIDLPDTARITRMVATTSGQDTAPSGEWVLMTREDFDALLVRVLLAEAGAEDQAMRLVAAAAYSQDVPA